jgi:hypothetical protein
MPLQSVEPWLTVIPVTASRSSYNGLLLLAFIIFSASVTAAGIHRFASRVVRRSAAWDCGHPDRSPATQYTGGSFSQPIRRVFGSVVFRVSETVDMPLPGDVRPARQTLLLHDTIWDRLYMPIAAGVGIAAERLNHFQFLTIRSYLSLVFGALVVLLLVVALWQ